MKIVSPKSEKSVKFAFISESLSQAVESIKNIMQTGARPAVVRIYDIIETVRLS